MTPRLFDIDSLIQARLELIRKARALAPGADRNQKRQIARSLKRLSTGRLKRDRSREADNQNRELKI